MLYKFHMKQSFAPPFWLLILIVGLPILSETVYTPALPDIARSLSVPESWVEYTLTIYLVGFALGAFLWGILSDKHGRKPCILIGFAIYILGSIGCYFSSSIEMLLLARLGQAIGGSVGSVLGQAITRDSFQGAALSKVYATVGSALGVFPALGPILGGAIDQAYGWPAIFLLLIVWGSFIWTSVSWVLPETHPKHLRQPTTSILSTGLRLLKDPRALGCCFLVGGTQGIVFSYYAEGPFYLINLLGLTPSTYGGTFFGISGALVLSGLVSKKFHDRYSPLAILKGGLVIMLIGQSLFCTMVLASLGFEISNYILLSGVVGCMMINAWGSIMVTSNALSLSLVNYRDVTGTASSLFGCGYYLIISLFTYGMALLHNGTLFPMPFYFLSIVLGMGGVYFGMLQPSGSLKNMSQSA